MTEINPAPDNSNPFNQIFYELGEYSAQNVTLQTLDLIQLGIIDKIRRFIDVRNAGIHLDISEGGAVGMAAALRGYRAISLIENPVSALTCEVLASKIFDLPIQTHILEPIVEGNKMYFDNYIDVNKMTKLSKNTKGLSILSGTVDSMAFTYLMQEMRQKIGSITWSFPHPELFPGIAKDPVLQGKSEEKTRRFASIFTPENGQLILARNKPFDRNQPSNELRHWSPCWQPEKQTVITSDSIPRIDRFSHDTVVICSFRRNSKPAIEGLERSNEILGIE